MTSLDVGGPNVSVSVLNRAVSAQSLNPHEVQEELRKLLQPGSPLWSALSNLFGSNVRDRVGKTGLTILIDDFSQFSSRRPIFASYFLREPIRVIGLDSSELARAYWLPSLAHEITHALLADWHLESWWEEALAQLIERQVGGMQPELTLKTLGEDGPLPFLFDTARPLLLRKNYALTFLFGKYLHAVAGGWQGLRVASGIEGANARSTSAPQSSPSETMADLSLRLRLWKEQNSAGTNSGASDSLDSNGAKQSSNAFALSPDKLTREGILRFFFVALAVNHPTYARYRIPDWNGTLNVERQLDGLLLQPGQFALGRLSELPSNLNPELEVYRLLQGPDGEVVIRPRQRFSEDQVGFRLVKDRTIVMNLTKDPQPVFPPAP